MTIAVAVQVHDGIVLSSDSASTLIAEVEPGKVSILNVYNNANKVFNLCKGSPIGGPIEIAAITKHEGFKWVRRKHYFSDALNRTERDE